MTLPRAIVLIAAAGAIVAIASADSAESRPAKSQALAELVRAHTAYVRPVPRSPRVRRVSARRPITYARTVLPVLERVTVGGEAWLKVRLPGRPNSATGWIRKRGTAASSTPWHLVVAPGRRQVLVYRGGRRVQTFSAIVGSPVMPTPAGRFFVEESVLMPPRAAGAPYALALSARSNVLQEFAGGPGQTAIHGLGNVGGRLGTAVSHGCVRLGYRAIAWLAARMGAGVPVTIR